MQKPSRGVDFEYRRRVVSEEARFRRASHDDVKQVEPFEVFSVADVVVDEIIHDDVCVIPQRVREQKHLFPARSQSLEQRNQVCVLRDVLAGIFRHGVL